MKMVFQNEKKIASYNYNKNTILIVIEQNLFKNTKIKKNTNGTFCTAPAISIKLFIKAK